ncbi:MAG: hypothetical protein AABX70_04025 [Nanoarchaeota archaeon]
MQSLDELRKELNYSPQEIMESYTNKNTALARQVKIAFEQANIPVEIQNVGSAAAERISIVHPLPIQSELEEAADENCKQGLFIPDFDIDIITPEKIVPDRIKKIMKTVCPFAPVANEDRFPTFYQGQGTYYISFAVLSRSEADKEAPNRYARSQESWLTSEQALEARVLKYIAMDNWAYGGWNRGLRGIAAEQLVKIYGKVEKVLEALALGLEEGTLFVPNPISPKSNLISNLSRQNKKRLLRLAWGFVEEEEIFSLTYTGFSKNGVATELLPCTPITCGTEPHTLRKTLLERIGGELKSAEDDIDLCLVPSTLGGGTYFTEVLAAVEKTRRKKKEIQFILKKLDEDLGRHHSTAETLSIDAYRQGGAWHLSLPKN